MALSETIQSSSDGLNIKNTSVSVVGVDQSVVILEGSLLAPYVSFSMFYYSIYYSIYILLLLFL